MLCLAEDTVPAITGCPRAWQWEIQQAVGVVGAPWHHSISLKGEWFKGGRRWKKRGEDRFSYNELVQEECQKDDEGIKMARPNMLPR